MENLSFQFQITDAPAGFLNMGKKSRTQLDFSNQPMIKEEDEIRLREKYFY